MSVEAAYIERHGPPEAIRVGPLPEPPMGPTDVRVEVHATAVNPVDTRIRSGRYPTATPFPFIIGRDLTGRVVATGRGAAAPFAPGDLVWCNSMGHGGRQGACARYVDVPVERLYHLPHGVDPTAAVATLHPVATAHVGLVRAARLRFGERVLIGGGGGNVGGAAVRLATSLGATVVATARPEDAGRCRQAGAVAVVDHREPFDRITDVAGDIDVYWDTSGNHHLDTALRIMRPGGRIIVAAAARPDAVLPIGHLYRNDLQILGFALTRASTADLADAARTINTTLARGAYEARIAWTGSLDDAAEAHRQLEAGGVRGRIALVPD